MPEPSIQHVALDPALWGILLPPLVGAALAFAFALREERARSSSVRLASVRRRVAVLAAGGGMLSLALVVSRAARIADMPTDARVLIDHVLRLVRVGSLDVDLDLAFDPITAVASGVIALAGIVTLGLGARAGGERDARATGALSLGVAALLLACLSADAAVMFAAIDLSVLALVFATDRASSLTRAALAAGALSFSGVAIVFWGLGGGWAGGDYTVDFSPRVVAVRESSSSDDDDDDARTRGAAGEGSLTLVSHPGAVVFLDGARTPLLDGDHALRSPFVRHPIASGRHSIRVHSGAGADDFVVSDALAAAGEEMTIAWVGPTLSFREMRDSLALRDALGTAAIREAFLGRELATGVRLADSACVLVLSGVFATALVFFAAARRRGAPLLGSAAVVAIVWYVAARLDPLLAMAPVGRVVLALIGCAAFVLAAARARLHGEVAPALAALLLLGAAVRASPFGGIVVVAGSLALASAELTRTGSPHAIARSALFGAPIPLLGVSWGAFGVVDAAWSTPPGGRALGAVIVLAAITGAFLLGACARPVAKKSVAGESHGLPRTSLALAVVAAALGPLLGASRAWIGERGDASAARLFEPFVGGWHTVGSTHPVAVALAWTGATLGGWAYGARRVRQTTDRAGAPATGDGGDEASGVTRAALDLLVGVDRWVVSATIGAMVNGARVAAWSMARVGGALLEAPSDAAARAVQGAAGRSGVAKAGIFVAGAATLVLAAWAAR